MSIIIDGSANGTAISDTATQTLSNKTLVSPVITGTPVINGVSVPVAYGNWTPVVNGTTLSANSGWYMKIGNLVYVGFNNQAGIAAISAGANFLIGGFPYPIKTDAGSSNYKYGGALSITFNDASDSYKAYNMIGRMNATSSPCECRNDTAVATTTSDPINMTAFYITD